MARKKAPAFQFYVRDWLSEPEVRRLSLASRGIWIDILSYMWLEEEQGKLEVELPELARMCGASEAEIERFLYEAEKVDLCDLSRFCPENVPGCPEFVRLVSRRMYREWIIKNNEKLRKRKQRASGGCPENVPPPSSSSSASANNNLTNSSLSNPSFDQEGQAGEREENPSPQSGPKRTDAPSKSRPSWTGFQSCWDVYPKKQGQEEAWREWCRLEDNRTLEEPFAIRDAILLLAQEDDGWRGGYAPKMARWLNGKGWNDEPYRKPVQDRQAQGQCKPEAGPLGMQLPKVNSEAQRQAQDRELAARMLLERRNQSGNQAPEATSGRHIAQADVQLPGVGDRAGAGGDTG